MSEREGVCDAENEGRTRGKVSGKVVQGKA